MNEREFQINELVKSSHHPQLNSVLVWQDGQLQAECYFNGFTAESRHNIKSVVKSILSIGIGIAQEQGLLNVDDKISKYLTEFDEGRDLQHRMITIKHLLTMSSGIFWQGGVHYHCHCQVKTTPGTVYNYKEFDVILLSAILSKVTGDAFDYINEKLFIPLEIYNDRWIKSPDGVYYSPALDKEEEAVSALTAREMLKIGQLFLQKGIWKGKQIISKEYIEAAVSPSPQNSNYGYLWWLGEGWYGCRGYGGQAVTVFPEQNKIVVTQATATSRPLTYEDIWFGDL